MSAPANDETLLLTTAELAERLRCKPETLARWRRGGRGPAYVRVAGRVLYAPADVHRWLRERLQAGEQ
jgi:predicted site-specific integrase-resolvase